MKSANSKILGIAIFFFFYTTIGCSTVSRNTINQFSTIDLLLAGAYDGQVSLEDILNHGNLGIGTFDRLDGEGIIINGIVYQVRADGKVYRPNKQLTSPFAVVVNFNTDIKFSTSNLNSYQMLEAAIDKVAPNKQLFAAIRAHGTFSNLKTRSVKAQNKPYPPLLEATKNQSIFELKNVSGTLIGFRSPDYTKGLGIPGYHLHFISDDLSSGGHVLELALDQAQVEIDICNKILVVSDENETSDGEVDLVTNRAEDLMQAEH